MSNLPYEQNPYMSPDSTRKFLNTNKKLFDAYTKKNYCETDLYGITNTGTVENFGSEVLLESRRLANNRIEQYKDIYSSDFKFYFDFMWSPLTPTTDNQHTVVQAVLKNDVMIEGLEYKLIFKNVEKKVVIRAKSTSDANVKKEEFYYATALDLVITDEDDETTTINLVKTTDTKFKTMFYINKFTKVYADYTEADNTVTVELFKSMIDLPWVWTSFGISDIDEYNIILSNNTDQNNNPLLTFGRDGHYNGYLYPLIYGEDNVPEVDEEIEDAVWFVKCYTDPTVEEYSVGIDRTRNPMMNVVRIDYCYGTSIGNISESFSINVSGLNNAKLTINPKCAWSYKKPVEDDTDYDGITFLNYPYAYIELSQFDINTQSPDDEPVLKAGWCTAGKQYTSERDIDSFLYNDSRAGLFADALSEFSVNGVIKKNGIVHELGDFDGLPKYFKYHLDETVHRIHAELYAIKQKTNRKDPVTRHGVAAIICDTAIPQTEGSYVLDGLNVCIKYDYSSGRTFRTVSESIDPKNVLSEIVYVDDQTMGCSSEAKYMINHKYVYHGNRVFSLTKAGLDPELEIARVYHISNDKSTYMNNDAVDDQYKKPLATLARICDIPTSLLQLIQVEFKSPTIVIDDKYVRSECSFSASDKQTIWNGIRPTFISKDNVYILKDLLGLQRLVLLATYPSEYMNSTYPHYIQLTGSLDLKEEASSYTLSVAAGGSGFVVNDIVSCMMSGRKIKFKVTEVSGTAMNKVTIITNNDDDFKIDKSFFPTQTTVFNVSKETGNGLDGKISVAISNSKWSLMNKSTTEPIETLRALCMDVYNNIWVYQYINSTWKKECQLTGVEVTPNFYDESATVNASKRSTKSVFLRNMFAIRSYHGSTTPNISFQDVESPTTEVTKVQVKSGNDLSNILKILGVNKLHGYYAFNVNDDDTIDLYIENTSTDTSMEQLLLPRFNQVNIKDNITNYSNKLRTYSVGKRAQVIPYIYNPLKEYKDYIVNGKYVNYGKFLISNLFNSSIVSNGVLTTNLYSFNTYKMTRAMVDLRDSLELSTRESLINYIKTNFEDGDPLSFESTAYAYSHDALVNYIMQRTYPDPSYNLYELNLLRNMNDTVENEHPTSKDPMGEQQSGWYEWLNGYHDTYKTINESQYTSNTLRVFRINSNVIFDNLSFRVFDEADRDISRECLLIYDNTAYIFNGLSWTNIHEIQNFTEED